MNEVKRKNKVVNKIYSEKVAKTNGPLLEKNPERLPEILFISSHPPRECGIATYSQDLVKALNNKFVQSFVIKICAVESETERHEYPLDISCKLNASDPQSYIDLVCTINKSPDIKLVLIQHEFGFFQNEREGDFVKFLNALTKPIVVVFHTVLPGPNELLRANVKAIVAASAAIIVMTHNSAGILAREYDVHSDLITVIPHGTHLVPPMDKKELKEKYKLTGRKVLSTFGLLSSGKSIETTLDALPEIIKENPDVIFLIMGKTHPSILRNEGEKYRDMLKAKIEALHLEPHVRFVNYYLPLTDLLEYLQLTDIYLFTSKDPNQAVSGTFSYAMSCGCAIISTPIPHVKEVLGSDSGIIIDFENPSQLAKAANRLLSDKQLMKNISLNALHRIASTAWENSAIAHAVLFEEVTGKEIKLKYSLPAFNIEHVKKLTTDCGIIQFSKLNIPDLSSGYTLDDNARALIAMIQYFELSKDSEDLKRIRIYFNFIKYCFQPEGHFLNYVDCNKNFTSQNKETNLEDSNGRAIWALGYLTSVSDLPADLTGEANTILHRALPLLGSFNSPRAMSFVVKGLCYCNTKLYSVENSIIIKTLTNKLVQMYKHESEKGWNWYESYLTYANSVLSEAVLCAYSETGDHSYRDIAKESFNFLISKTFTNDKMKVISNKSWLHKGEEVNEHGEQPIDVCYTILALARFYDVFMDKTYLRKMEIAFNWFLGANSLQQIVYNPCTGGCYDGLEQDQVNLNQGAESTVSYLLARETVEKYLKVTSKLSMHTLMPRFKRLNG